MRVGLEQIEEQARRDRLTICGAFHPGPQDSDLSDVGTLVLLGPHEPGFWDSVHVSPELADGLSDPMDRWSARVIARLARDLGAKALFPFGGPPHRPFFDWAIRSGRAWRSPVSLLVHDQAGLMVSYRGALALPDRMDLPTLAPCPCETCTDKPCRSACPVNALKNSAYDLATCHGYLDTGPGRDCLTRGCAVRRACPISQRYGRTTQQSAFHMKAFHP